MWAMISFQQLYCVLLILLTVIIIILHLRAKLEYVSPVLHNITFIDAINNIILLLLLLLRNMQHVTWGITLHVS